MATELDDTVDETRHLSCAWTVRLFCEQEAVLEVQAPVDVTETELRELALQALDASGGAEWETINAWTEARHANAGVVAAEAVES